MPPDQNGRRPGTTPADHHHLHETPQVYTDTTAERALIAAILHHQDGMAEAVELGCDVGWFTHPSYAWIAAVALDLHDQDQPVNLITLENGLTGTGDPWFDLRDIVDKVTRVGPPPGTVADYCHRLRAAADERHGPDDPDEETSAGFVDWANFWSQDRATGDWALEPIIAAGRATHIYARRATGKSELLLAGAVGLATGRQPLDGADVAPVPVVFIDTEMGEADLFDRLVDLGHGPDSDLSRLHYAALPSLPPLNTAAGGQHLLTWCLDVGARLVILDSLQPLLDGEENSNDVYNDLLHHTLGPLKRAGIASCSTGNTGKDPGRGSRGGSRKEDIADVVWELRRGDGDRVHLINTKKRMGWVPDHVHLTRRDEDGTIAYRLAADAVPAGTADVVARLDAADVPLDASVRDANRILRAAGKGARTEVLAAALRARKARGPVSIVGKHPGKHPRTAAGKQAGKHPAEMAGDQGETVAGNSGKHPAPRLVVCSPPIGGNTTAEIDEDEVEGVAR